MIELIHAAAPKFAAKTKLMRSHAVGHDIGDVVGEVAAPLRRRQSNLLKVANLNVRSAVDGLPVGGCTRAEEQSHLLCIEASVKVVKDLVEIISTYQYLVREPARERGIQHQRLVENVERRHFEVVLQVRAGRSQCGAATEWGRLAALSTEKAHIEVVFVVDLIIHLCNAIVAISS